MRQTVTLLDAGVIGNKLSTCLNILWFQGTTVYLLKLDTLFFFNNSTNTHRRPTKPFAMCFYSPVWHFDFCDLFFTFEYLDLLRWAWHLWRLLRRQKNPRCLSCATQNLPPQDRGLCIPPQTAPWAYSGTGGGTPPWHTQFLRPRNLWHISGMGLMEWFPLDTILIFLMKMLSYFDSVLLILEMALYKKPPLKIPLI